MGDKWRISLFVILVWATLLYYLQYRWRYACLGFATLFVLCESVVIVWGGMNLSFLIWGLHLQKNRSPQVISIRDIPRAEWPRVIILIPTYNEEKDVLESTLTAVLRLDYPKEKIGIILGDDGARSWVENMIHDIFPDVRYCTRTKVHGHAKAGNINNMLQCLDEEGDHENDLILILDCDMMPTSKTLIKMIPLFYHRDVGTGRVEKNKKCAFVQSPQEFRNIRGCDFLGQQYLFFYQVVMKAYSGFSLGVPCCGTNVLFSYKNLMSIGGLQYGSITEDFLTSLRLHSEGYHSRYMSDRTCLGLSPTTFYDFFVQRERWATGGFQIVFSSAFCEYTRRLPWEYKWIYFMSGIGPFLSIPMLILMVGPLLDMAYKHVFMCGANWDSYVFHLSPYAIVYAIGLVCIHWGVPSYVFLLSLQESIFMIPVFNVFVWHFLWMIVGCKKISFKTTPKQASSKVPPSCQLSVVWLLYTLYWIATVSLIFWRAVSGYVMYPSVAPNIRTYGIDLFWIFFTSLQFLNPLLYVCQNTFRDYYCFCIGRDRDDASEGTNVV